MGIWIVIGIIVILMFVLILLRRKGRDGRSKEM